MSEDHVTFLGYVVYLGVIAFCLFSAAGLLSKALHWFPPRWRGSAGADEAQAAEHDGLPIYGGPHLHLENQAPPKNLRVTEDTEQFMRLCDDLLEEMKAQDE